MDVSKTVRILFAGGAGVALITGSAAFAASPATTTFTVEATVASACTVSAPKLQFGIVDPTTAADKDASNNMTIKCSNGLTYTVALNKGTTTGGTFAQRLITNGTDTLNYNLYTTAARTTVFGDGTAGTVTQAGTGTGANQTMTVYGRVTGSQANVSAGTYSDVITVTVSWP